MKTYAIISMSKEQCIAVRTKLIKGGIEWICEGGKNPRLHSDDKHITLVAGPEMGRIGKYDADSISVAINYAQERNYEIITAYKFLENPTIIPGYIKAYKEKKKTGKNKFAILSTDREQCAKVRVELIRGGILWEGGKKDPYLYPNDKYVTLVYRNKIHRSVIYDICDMLAAIDLAQKYNCSIVIASKFLKNPTIIPGWKEPSKEPMSEAMIETSFGKVSLSTIEEMLEKHFEKRKNESVNMAHCDIQWKLESNS